jgi:transposase
VEATGIYWKPVYAVIEDDFDVVVGNAHHIKNVPGRKTDVKDSEWIADVLRHGRHGLIAKSFVPPKPIRVLRDELRDRRKLVENRSAERNRLQKLLETANIKLASVASDVFGVSGMAMLNRCSSRSSAQRPRPEMAQLAKSSSKRLRQKLAELELALEGKPRRAPPLPARNGSSPAWSNSTSTSPSSMHASMTSLPRTASIIGCSARSPASIASLLLS